MQLGPEKVTTKKGNEYILRSIGPDNVEEFLDFMRQVSADTHFMSRYSDEVGSDEYEVLAEKARLKTLYEDSRQGMISVFDGDRIIGNVAIRTAGKGRKTNHRCSIGIGIRKEYTGQGLGSILMDHAIEFAKSVGYEIMELGVLSDNTPARSMYEKMGFTEWGCLPGAFHLDEGDSLDEITMYKEL